MSESGASPFAKPPGSRSKLRNALFLAAAALGLAAVVLIPLVVVRFGRVDPSPASLSDDPRNEIPGELLYRDYDGCLVRAAASGATRERLFCGIPYVPISGGARSYAWVDAETVAYVVHGMTLDSAHVTELDLRMNAKSAGERRIRVPGPKEVGRYGQLEPISVHGERASVTDDGKLRINRNGEQDEIADFDIAGLLRVVTWSPDGEWLALSYLAEEGDGRSEIWLISRDGKVRGTLAKGLGDVQVSWRIEGAGIAPLVVE